MPTVIYTIDVAHPPRHPDMIEGDILAAWQKVRNSPDFRILKIIHGKGVPGSESRARVVVRNWLFLNKSRFKGVIDGEEFNLYNATVEEMLKSVGNVNDPDGLGENAGVTYVWVK